MSTCIPHAAGLFPTDAVKGVFLATLRDKFCLLAYEPDSVFHYSRHPRSAVLIRLGCERERSDAGETRLRCAELWISCFYASATSTKFIKMSSWWHLRSRFLNAYVCPKYSVSEASEVMQKATQWTYEMSQGQEIEIESDTMHALFCLICGPEL